MEAILIACAVCAGASFVGAFTQRVSGFGYGIVVMMMFPLVLSHAEATALSGLVSIFLSGYVAFTLRRHIRWKQILIPALSYIVTSYLCIWFVKGADTALIKKLLGGMLVILSLYFLFFSKKIKIRPTVSGALMAGGLSGIMSGLFAMGGPPMVVYYLSASETNDEYLATIQGYFAVTGVIATVIRLINGMVTAQVWYTLPAALATMLLANYLGKRVYGKLSPDLLKKVVYGFMAFSGILNLAF